MSGQFILVLPHLLDSSGLDRHRRGLDWVKR